MGTFVTKSFIEERSHSWQAHIKRISPFLLTSKVWWKESENGFRFLDSDLDFCFRSCTLDTIEAKSSENLEKIMDCKTEIPTTLLIIFDEAGDFLSFMCDGIDQNDRTPSFDDIGPSTGDTCTFNSISTPNPVPVTSTPVSCNSNSIDAYSDVSITISTFSIMCTSTHIASPPTVHAILEVLLYHSFSKNSAK